MPNLNLRLSEDLHSALVAAASASGRSLQREIVMRLEGRVAGFLPERTAVPGEALPPLPESAYPEGSRPLPDVRVGKRSFRPDFKGGSKK